MESEADKIKKKAIILYIYNAEIIAYVRAPSPSTLLLSSFLAWLITAAIERVAKRVNCGARKSQQAPVVVG